MKYDRYKLLAVMKDETDIIVRITARPVGQVVILVSINVQTFKTDVIMWS